MVSVRKHLKCVVFRSLDKSFRDLVATFLTNRVEKSSKSKSLSVRVMFGVVDMLIRIINKLENYTFRKYFKLGCYPKDTAIARHYALQHNNEHMLYSQLVLS